MTREEAKVTESTFESMSEAEQQAIEKSIVDSLIGTEEELRRWSRRVDRVLYLFVAIAAAPFVVAAVVALVRLATE